MGQSMVKLAGAGVMTLVAVGFLGWQVWLRVGPEREGPAMVVRNGQAVPRESVVKAAARGTAAGGRVAAAGGGAGATTTAPRFDHLGRPLGPDGKVLARAGATRPSSSAMQIQVTKELKGHKQGVTALAFSPDDTRLASAGADGVVRVWDVESGATVQTLMAGEGVLAHVAWSGDGKRIVAGGWDKTVVAWEVETGKFLGRLQGIRAGAPVVFFPDGDHVAAGGEDSLEIHALRPEEAEGAGQTEGAGGAAEFPTGGRVVSLAVSPDGKHLALGTERATVMVVDGGLTLEAMRTRVDPLEMKEQVERETWMRAVGVHWAEEGKVLFSDGMGTWVWGWREGTVGLVSRSCPRAAGLDGVAGDVMVEASGNVVQAWRWRGTPAVATWQLPTSCMVMAGTRDGKHFAAAGGGGWKGETFQGTAEASVYLFGPEAAAALEARLKAGEVVERDLARMATGVPAVQGWE